MTFVFSYMEHYHKDLWFSDRSDLCFLLGSFLYCIVASMECFFELKPSLLCQDMLGLGGPLLFLMNSAIDVHWALHAKQRQGVKNRMKQTFEDALVVQGVEKQPAVWWWTKVRRHAAHRRTIYAATTFGVAALLAVISVLLEYSGDDAGSNNNDGYYASWFDWGSDHMYVVSAVIAISGKRTRPWFSSSTSYWGALQEPEFLEDMGDFLFLIGSVLDSLLDDYFNNLREKETPSILGVVSSLLWLVDALFYLRSDFVMAHRVNKHSTVNENDPSAVFV